MKLIRKKLRISLATLTIAPILVLGTFFILFGIKTIKTCTETEVMSTLQGVCLRLRDDFSTTYPGDYSVDGTHFYSGDEDISPFINLLLLPSDGVAKKCLSVLS